MTNTTEAGIQGGGTRVFRSTGRNQILWLLRAVSGIFILSLAGCGSTSPTSKLTHVKSISVQGVIVSVGDLAEDALKAFTPEDENPHKGLDGQVFSILRVLKARGRSLDDLTSINYIIGNNCVVAKQSARVIQRLLPIDLPLRLVVQFQLLSL